MLIYTSGSELRHGAGKAGKAQCIPAGRQTEPVQPERLRCTEHPDDGGINFDSLLLGVTSYSPETGFTCGVEDEARLKQTVLRRCDCEQKAVLLDSSRSD